MTATQEPSPRVGSEHPPLRIARLNKSINLVMTRLFRANDCNITREQEVILRELARGDGVNQVELAARTGQERNNLSRTLTILERKGWIERRTCQNDKRNSLVYITEEGAAMQRQAYAVVKEYQKVLYAGLEPTETQVIAEAVRKLTGNLENFLEEQAGDEIA